MALSVDLKDFQPTAAVFAGSVKVDGKLVSSARSLRMVPQDRAGA
jgi:hypothetical protein